MTNRAARRASGIKTARNPKVRVSNRVIVVPMEHIEMYFTHEITNEGRWSANRPLVILRPTIDSGQTTEDWLATTLERMRETRSRKGLLPTKVPIGQGREVEIDIGLIDVTVFFQVPPGMRPAIPTRKEDCDRTFDENLRHLESVCADALHDQMILATSLHLFDSNGSPLLHYHNLIFGMRQEVRGELDVLGQLDMDPLLKALSKSGPMRLIGGKQQ